MWLEKSSTKAKVLTALQKSYCEVLAHLPEHCQLEYPYEYSALEAIDPAEPGR